jgi:hypothetical protein
VTMNSGWCLWSSPLHKRFRKRSDCTRCDLRDAYFCFPPFKWLIPGHSVGCLGDPVRCRFICWIPRSCHNFRSVYLSCRRWSRHGSPLFRSDSVSLCVDSLYVDVINAMKVLAAFSAFSIVSICFRGGISSQARLRNRS